MSESQQVLFTLISPIFEEIRNLTENFLEGNGEEADRALIKEQLEGLHQAFNEQQFPIAAQSCDLAKQLVDLITPFGETETEDLLLRLCLIISHMIEEHELGIQPQDQIYSHYFSILQDFLINDRANESVNTEFKVDFSLIRVLRTVFQRQIVRLIQEKDDPTNVLHSMKNAVSELLDAFPPQYEHPHIQAFLFYLNTTIEKNIPVNEETYRFIGISDLLLGRFIKQRARITHDYNLIPEYLEALSNLPGGSDWLREQQQRIDRHLDDLAPSISAGTYARFFESIKEPLIALHESLEKAYNKKDFYIDEQHIDFLNQLESIFHLMQKTHLADLVYNTSNLLSEEELEQNFNQVVENIYMIETYAAKLWDSNIPISGNPYQDFKDLMQTNANQHAFSALAAVYSKLRFHLESNNEITEADLAQFKEAHQVQTLLNYVEPLSTRIISAIDQGLKDKTTLIETALALEYCTLRNAEDNDASESILETANQLLDVFETKLQKENIETTLDETNSNEVGFDPSYLENDNDQEASKPFEHLAQIKLRIESICLGWEAIGESDICRAALASALQELYDIAILEDNKKVIELAYSWYFWLDLPASPVELKHTPQLKAAVQQMILNIEKDVNADNLQSYLQFIHDTFGETELISEAWSSNTTPEQEPLIADDHIEIDLEILEAFKSELATLYESTQHILVQPSITQKELDELKRIAHTIRGNSALISLTDIAQKASDIEKNLNTMPAITSELIFILQSKFAELYQQLFISLKEINKNIDIEEEKNNQAEDHASQINVFNPDYDTMASNEPSSQMASDHNTLSVEDNWHDAILPLNEEDWDDAILPLDEENYTDFSLNEDNEHPANTDLIQEEQTAPIHIPNEPFKENSQYSESIKNNLSTVNAQQLQIHHYNQEDSTHIEFAENTLPELEALDVANTPEAIDITDLVNHTPAKGNPSFQLDPTQKNTVDDIAEKVEAAKQQLQSIPAYKHMDATTSIPAQLPTIETSENEEKEKREKEKEDLLCGYGEGI